MTLISEATSTQTLINDDLPDNIVGAVRVFHVRSVTTAIVNFIKNNEGIQRAQYLPDKPTGEQTGYILKVQSVDSISGIPTLVWSEDNTGETGDTMFQTSLDSLDTRLTNLTTSVSNIPTLPSPSGQPLGRVLTITSADTATWVLPDATTVTGFGTRLTAVETSVAGNTASLNDVRQVPSTEGASKGYVLTIAQSGYEWRTPPQGDGTASITLPLDPTDIEGITGDGSVGWNRQTAMKVALLSQETYNDSARRDEVLNNASDVARPSGGIGGSFVLVFQVKSSDTSLSNLYMAIAGSGFNETNTDTQNDSSVQDTIPLSKFRRIAGTLIYVYSEGGAATDTITERLIPGDHSVMIVEKTTRKHHYILNDNYRVFASSIVGTISVTNISGLSPSAIGFQTYAERDATVRKVQGLTESVLFRVPFNIAYYIGSTKHAVGTTLTAPDGTLVLGLSSEDSNSGESVLVYNKTTLVLHSSDIKVSDNVDGVSVFYYHIQGIPGGTEIEVQRRASYSDLDIKIQIRANTDAIATINAGVNPEIAAFFRGASETRTAGTGWTLHDNTLMTLNHVGSFLKAGTGANEIIAAGLEGDADGYTRVIDEKTYADRGFRVFGGDEQNRRALIGFQISFDTLSSRVLRDILSLYSTTNGTKYPILQRDVLGLFTRVQTSRGGTSSKNVTKYLYNSNGFNQIHLRPQSSDIPENQNGHEGRGTLDASYFNNAEARTYNFDVRLLMQDEPTSTEHFTYEVVDVNLSQARQSFVGDYTTSITHDDGRKETFHHAYTVFVYYDGATKRLYVEADNFTDPDVLVQVVYIQFTYEIAVQVSTLPTYESHVIDGTLLLTDTLDIIVLLTHQNGTIHFTMSYIKNDAPAVAVPTIDTQIPVDDLKFDQVFIGGVDTLSRNIDVAQLSTAVHDSALPYNNLMHLITEYGGVTYFLWGYARPPHESENEVEIATPVSFNELYTLDKEGNPIRVGNPGSTLIQASGTDNNNYVIPPATFAIYITADNNVAGTSGISVGGKWLFPWVLLDVIPTGTDDELILDTHNPSSSDQRSVGVSILRNGSTLTIKPFPPTTHIQQADLTIRAIGLGF